MSGNYLLIGADLVPTDSNVGYFERADGNKLVGDSLFRILKESDYNIFNLETPLTDKNNPILKWGPVLRAPSATVVGYKSLNVNLLTLSNNHILDQGYEGLIETIKTLEDYQIEHVGAGMDLQSASDAFYFQFAGKTVGVYACAESEFSIAGDATPGANPFDPLFSFDHIYEASRKCDFLIVLYHGGKEHYRYPSPYLQKVCRRIVDKGADLVVCQHSHCIGCREVWQHKEIIYGQGNFIFDKSEIEEWQTSILIKIDSNFNSSYIPIIKCNETVRIADEKNREVILSEFEKRSKQIEDESFVLRNYNSFSDESLGSYLITSAGKNSIFIRILDRLLNRNISKRIPNRRFTSSELLALINYIECEAHRELFLTGMKEKIKNKS